MEDDDDDEVSQNFPSKDFSEVLNDCAANLMSVLVSFQMRSQFCFASR